MVKLAACRRTGASVYLGLAARAAQRVPGYQECGMGVHTNLEAGLQASVATTFDVLAWEMELAGARCLMVDAIIGELMQTLPEDLRGRLHEGMHAVDLL